MGALVRWLWWSICFLPSLLSSALVGSDLFTCHTLHLRSNSSETAGYVRELLYSCFYSENNLNLCIKNPAWHGCPGLCAQAGTSLFGKLVIIPFKARALWPVALCIVYSKSILDIRKITLLCAVLVRAESDFTLRKSTRSHWQCFSIKIVFKNNTWAPVSRRYSL